MEKRILKISAAAVLAILGLTFFSQVMVDAQVGEINDQSLIGSWDVVVTPRDCETGDTLPFPPAFVAVQTYNQGGTMLASNLGAPGVTSLEGHGVWLHGKGRRYSIAFRIVKFNPDGSYAGKDVVRDSISLALDGKSYTSAGNIEAFDAAGSMLFRGCATSSAIRFE